MDGQISLIDITAPEAKELEFLYSILPRLKEAVASHGGDPELFQIRPTKSDTAKSQSSGYCSVYFFHFTAFRLHLRGEKHYISVPQVFWDMIPPEFPLYTLKSEHKYKRILVDAHHPAESYTDFLALISGEVVNRYPKEWDCCSRYMECSDAKTCVHPDRTFALGCGYRKILNSGRIFYGKNRNID